MKSKQLINKVLNKHLVAKFIIVGSTAFIVNYLMLELLITTFNLHKAVAEAIAMIITVNLSFLAHDNWTYVLDKSIFSSSHKVRYASYMISNSSGSVITIVLFTILARSLPNLIALAIAALVAMCWNFAMNLIIWKQKGAPT